MDREISNHFSLLFLLTERKGKNILACRANVVSHRSENKFTGLIEKLLHKEVRVETEVCFKHQSSPTLFRLIHSENSASHLSMQKFFKHEIRDFWGKKPPALKLRFCIPPVSFSLIFFFPLPLIVRAFWEGGGKKG